MTRVWKQLQLVARSLHVSKLMGANLSELWDWNLLENIASTSLSLNLIIITSVYSYDNVCSDSKSCLGHTITQAASLLALELYKDSIKQHAFTNLLKVFNIVALIFLKSYIQSSGTFFFILMLPSSFKRWIFICLL